jgi:hypothetical protein
MLRRRTTPYGPTEAAGLTEESAIEGRLIELPGWGAAEPSDEERGHED